MPKFGLTLEQEGMNFEIIRSLAATGEELHYDSVWLGDHFFYSEQPFLECWTTLSALACATKRIRLGTQVLCNCYRHPPLVAKMAATLDVISGGRLILGLGAGWHKREYVAYGIPFRRDGIRVSRLEEAVEIIEKMWTQPTTTFTGKHYLVKDARCEPKPIQKPHPPIWIGGNGNRILSIVARHADGCNVTFGKKKIYTTGDFKERMRILEAHCSRIGKDITDIERALSITLILGRNEGEIKKELRRAVSHFTSKPGLSLRRRISFAYHNPALALSTVMAMLGLVKPPFVIAGTPEQCVEKIQEFVDAGVTYFTVSFPPALRHDVVGPSLFADEVMPQIS